MIAGKLVDIVLPVHLLDASSMLLIGTPAMPLALYALTAGAFGIGVTEFIVMGLLPEVGANLGVSIPVVGLLISGYALGVAVGAPLVTVLTGRWPRKGVLLGLMVVFSLGNAACALAPSFGLLMAARVLTALAHGTFFGVGSVVAADLVAPDRKASAVATMFTGLTAATILGVPLGTWSGQLLGWRAPFWAIAVLGLMVVAIIRTSRPPSARPPMRRQMARRSCSGLERRRSPLSDGSRSRNGRTLQSASPRVDER